MCLAPVLESMMASGDESSSHDIVELLASFSALKIPIELVLKIYISI